MFEHHQAPGDSVADMIGGKAMELLEFEGAERQARYELIKDQMFWSAVGEGMSTADAWDMSEKVGEWALALVGRITATGGAGGGHA